MKTMIAMALVLAAATCSLAGEGRVSDETLAKMGLADLEAMTDGEGQAIRGQGGTYANTLSATAVPGAFNITQATVKKPNFSFAANNSSSAGFYNIYFLPPMTAFGGAVGSAFATR